MIRTAFLRGDDRRTEVARLRQLALRLVPRSRPRASRRQCGCSDCWNLADHDLGVGRVLVVVQDLVRRRQEGCAGVVAAPRSSLRLSWDRGRHPVAGWLDEDPCAPRSPTLRNLSLVVRLDRSPSPPPAASSRPWLALGAGSAAVESVQGMDDAGTPWSPPDHEPAVADASLRARRLPGHPLVRGSCPRSSWATPGRWPFRGVSGSSARRSGRSD